MYAFTALHFIVGDVFAESHTCWYVLFIFWFVSRYFLSSFFNYFLACRLFKSVFNLHILVDFPTFPSTINFCFIALWQEKVPLYDLSLFRVDLFSGLTYGQFWRMCPVHLWKVWNLSLPRSHGALAARFLGVTSHCRAWLLGRSAIFVH